MVSLVGLSYIKNIKRKTQMNSTDDYINYMEPVNPIISLK